MVPFKNASVVVSSLVAGLSSTGSVLNPSLSGSFAVLGYFEEATPAEMFQHIGVEVLSPAYFQCELADASRFTPNAQVSVTVGSVLRGVYYVQGLPEQHFAGNDADHADVYLARTQWVIR